MRWRRYFGEVDPPSFFKVYILLHNSALRDQVASQTWHGNGVSSIMELRLETRYLEFPSSRGRSPSRPQPFARLSSVPRSIPPSSPALPQLPRQNRVSPRPNSSHASSAYRDQDVIRAPIRESDAEIEAREDSDAMNEVIMAVEMRDRGTIGCAYYIAREEKLCLMEDIKMAGLDILTH